MRLSGLLKASRLVVLGAALTASAPSFAALAVIAVVPTGWRLQNYTTNNISVYYTGITSCGGIAQQLIFDSSASADDKNRFWTTIMTGKTAGKKVFVYYDDATCVISSFGLLENG